MMFALGPRGLRRSDDTPEMHLASLSLGSYKWHQLAGRSLGPRKDLWGMPSSDL